MSDMTAWHQLRVRLGGLRAVVRTGVFEGAHSESGFDMAELMAVQELGTKDGHVPGRQPIRSTFRDRKAEIIALLATLGARTIKGSISPQTGLKVIGRWTVEAVRSRIMRGSLPPPLAPSTAARKGHSHPLYRTGELVDAIDFRVVIQ